MIFIYDYLDFDEYVFQLDWSHQLETADFFHWGLKWIIRSHQLPEAGKTYAVNKCNIYKYPGQKDSKGQFTTVRHESWHVHDFWLYYEADAICWGQARFQHPSFGIGVHPFQRKQLLWHCWEQGGGVLDWHKQRSSGLKDWSWNLDELFVDKWWQGLLKTDFSCTMCR